MKKSTFILAASVCLFLASCKTEDSCTYIIDHGVKEYSSAGNPDSEAARIYKDFVEAIIAFDSASVNDWRWTVTVKNENYGESDEEAVAKYEKYKAELEAINKEYADKLSKCTSTDYTVSEVHYLRLSRISASNAELACKDFSISYPAEK